MKVLHLNMTIYLITLILLFCVVTILQNIAFSSGGHYVLLFIYFFLVNLNVTVQSPQTFLVTPFLTTHKHLRSKPGFLPSHKTFGFPVFRVVETSITWSHVSAADISTHCNPEVPDFRDDDEAKVSWSFFFFFTSPRDKPSTDVGMNAFWHVPHFS